jgi:hypothetical protein
MEKAGMTSLKWSQFQWCCAFSATLFLTGCNQRPQNGPAVVQDKDAKTTHLPPAPNVVTSGSAKSTPHPATDRGYGGPGPGDAATRSTMNQLRGAVATINMPPPPLSERHDLLAGWIELYDGVSLFGWTAQSNANWNTANAMLSVDKGEPGLLTTNTEFGDYHLRVDYRCVDENVNSGIFLHTNDKPGRDDITTRCYELNIAPDSNPFPTGSIVGRAKSEKSIKSTGWHSLEAKVQGGHVTVFIDGTMTADYTDPRPLGRGKIGLQFNQGGIEFREVKIRPLGLGLFGSAGGQSGWKLDSKGKTALEVGADGDFRLRGGKGYLESEKQFKDFVLQVEAKTNRENQNSGIFFRTIPGSEMDGYECQINNAINNDGTPRDYGTGGIFNRQKAHIMPAMENRWFALTIVCDGPHMACWVNGTQVSDWTDDRPEDPNPRKGKRLEAGTIMLQGHDANTDVSFRLFRAGELPTRVEPEATP